MKRALFLTVANVAVTKIQPSDSLRELRKKTSTVKRALLLTVVNVAVTTEFGNCLGIEEVCYEGYCNDKSYD